MRYQLDEDKGDLLYEVENDNLILKIKPEVIASIGTPGTGGSGSGIYHIKMISGHRIRMLLRHFGH